jgi:phage-related protein
MYNGVSSKEMGLCNVNLQTGMLEEGFLPNGSVQSEKVRGNDIPYYTDMDYEPLQFTLNFAFMEGFDEDKVIKVAEWLSPRRFAPLIFENKLTHVYHCMPISGQLVHNALRQGYVALSFICNAPWAMTPMNESMTLTYPNNASNGSEYILNNYSSGSVMPSIEIQLLSGNNFKIVNNSNRGAYFEMTGLSVGEKIKVDFRKQNIETSLSSTYRYQNKTAGSQFFSLVQGKNYLTIYGKINIRWKWQGFIKG